ACRRRPRAGGTCSRWRGTSAPWRTTSGSGHRPVSPSSSACWRSISWAMASGRHWILDSETRTDHERRPLDAPAVSREQRDRPSHTCLTNIHRKGSFMTLDPSSLHGVIPPISTPLTPDRTLDVESFRRLIDHQIDAGIHGLFVLGSTSEAPLLTNAVQDQVIATAVEQVAGRIPVLAGCIDFTTARVIERGLRAKELGAD